MTDVPVLFSSGRPAGRTILTVRTGDASTTATDINLQNVTLVRIWPDHTLAAFNTAGDVLAFFRPGTYWSILWQ
ncbi:hypothetical protein JVX90_00355 [Gordonia sp. PDNC005]|uniref:hypothetical protein n=1 Tax=Gordonia sp. PDNC005 TaxID=2811424 RepID=UPI001963F0B5|nr:hypothetical protein [Gordonia sp. PDNC005]QRY62764.1 hypothetical protein JVX90_00355 [Gordonia sp. PDNC005]